jgi:hypothetical protein
MLTETAVGRHQNRLYGRIRNRWLAYSVSSGILDSIGCPTHSNELSRTKIFTLGLDLMINEAHRPSFVYSAEQPHNYSSRSRNIGYLFSELPVTDDIFAHSPLYCDLDKLI